MQSDKITVAAFVDKISKDIQLLTSVCQSLVVRESMLAVMPKEIAIVFQDSGSSEERQNASAPSLMMKMQFLMILERKNASQVFVSSDIARDAKMKLALT
jgi:hypothetical protein